PHPVFEDLDVLRLLRHVRDRHLVRTPSPLNRFPVHRLGTSPTFRSAQDDHRPNREFNPAIGAGIILNGANFLDDGVEGSGHELMRWSRLMPFNEIWLPAVSGKQMREF